MCRICRSSNVRLSSRSISSRRSIEARMRLPSRPCRKTNARSALATELGGHVPIGHDGVGGDEPTRAEPRQAVALHLDPADRLRRTHEVRPRSREP